MFLQFRRTQQSILQGANDELAKAVFAHASAALQDKIQALTLHTDKIGERAHIAALISSIRMAAVARALVEQWPGAPDVRATSLHEVAGTLAAVTATCAAVIEHDGFISLPAETIAIVLSGVSPLVATSSAPALPDLWTRFPDVRLATTRVVTASIAIAPNLMSEAAEKHPGISSTASQDADFGLSLLLLHSRKNS